MTRRDFIGNALAALGFSALPGGFLFAAPEGWKPGKKPNLVFGVVSDTHLHTRHGSSGKPAQNWPDKYFVAALEYFKRRGVDAVVHCGDMAHRGQVEEMQFHANAWNRVFGPSGGPVKLFVTGNHDAEGAGYSDLVEKNYPDPVERAKHVLATDMAANWERIWGEKYDGVWHKEVKGYHFFGRNWGVDDAELARLVEETGKTVRLDDPARPFFFMTHSRPVAPLRKRVSANRNAVSFFGHYHWSVANWNMAYLYYNRLPCFECASCEPRGCSALAGDDWITKAKLEGRDPANTGKGRQGYVVCMYDDMMVLERHDFSDGESSLGADWVMPFEECKVESVKCKVEGVGGARLSRPHPFSKEELKKVIGEPQFRKGAKLEVSLDRIDKINKIAKTANDNPVNPVNLVQENPATPRLRVRIPLADGNPDSRVYAYEVVVVGDEGTPKLRKAVYAAGCNLGIGHEPNGGVTTLEIPASELPAGKTLTVAVRPLSSLGTSGRAIAAKCRRDFRFPESI